MYYVPKVSRATQMLFLTTAETQTLETGQRPIQTDSSTADPTD